MQWADEVGDANDALLAELGEDITYLPNQGVGEPVAEKAILCDPEIDQSRGPGYFADIEVSPVRAREKRDEVVWGDGTVYVVTMVRRRPYGLVRLALHQKSDS